MPGFQIEEKLESVPFLPTNEKDISNTKTRSSSRTAWLALSIGTVLNVALFLSALIMYMRSQIRDQPGPLPTEIKDAWKAVQYETRSFTGALKWDRESGNMYREQDYTTEYFGPPTEKLDEAWEALLHDEFAPMNSEETAPFLPELRPFPGQDMPMFEPGVFHSLHCLNALRMIVSKQMYRNDTAEVEEYTASDIAHNEHCMDRIRQTLMCSGDLTPSPMYWWEGYGMALGRTGPQTCRKWEPIREWWDGRIEHKDSEA